MPGLSTEVIVALIAMVGILAGAIGSFAGQWYQGHRSAPQIQAEADKARAEADKTAAAAWHELYDEVCKRVEKLELKCVGLEALVRDVEYLKRENRRLKNKVNQVIRYYSELYHQALSAGLDPEHEPPDPEEIEEC